MRAESLKGALGLVICQGLREAERCLPLWCLRVLLWPAAAAAASRELAYAGPTAGQFDRLPPSFRPPSGRPARVLRMWRRRTEMNLAKMLCLWPDRLGAPRWLGRWGCTGIEQFEEARAGGRPVVLAVLHFGPLAVLRFWMRARGLPVAALLEEAPEGRPPYRRYLDRVCDRGGGVT